MLTPVIAGVNNTIVNYAPSTAPVPVAPGLTLTDSTSSTITSATVKITGNFAAGKDVLALVFTDGGKIAGTFNAKTGTLTLSGTDTMAMYQAALQSVTFFTNSTSTLQRQIAITVNGATNPAFTGYRYVNVS